jgi:hypothetical protein
VVLTVTVVFDVAAHPKLFVAVTVYVVVADGITPVGFWASDVNPAGLEVQLNVAAGALV